MVQKCHFSNFLFLGNIGQKNLFYYIQERKNAFLGYKNKTCKTSINWHYSKGVNPWFWCKNGNFSHFFFSGNIGQQNVFYDILERKNAFLGYKNKKFKNSKNWHFSKLLTHGFGPKMAILPTFFVREYRLGKCFLWYPKTKKRLSSLLKHEVQKLEKSSFFQKS